MNIARPSLLFLCLFILYLTSVAAHAGTWTTIDLPGFNQTMVLGINSAGDMVGTYGGCPCVGFLLHNGNLTTIDPPMPGYNLYAYGVNDSELVVGYYETIDYQDRHGFLWDGKTLTPLDYPGAVATAALGINNAGAVVGYYISNTFHGFKWSNGTFTTIDVPNHATVLTGINNRDFIDGCWDKNCSHVFLMNPEGGIRTFEALRTYLYFSMGGVNDHKQIVGHISLADGFRFNVKSKTLRAMRYPKSEPNTTVGAGINNSGQIVGYYQRKGEIFPHGFLWIP